MALNHYRLLGIPADAGPQQIRSAYRGLAKRFHPDRNRGSETAAELFRQINNAYRVLSDPVLRKQYDTSLQRDANGSPQTVEKGRKAPFDPQQKFNRFVKSLLDAMFGPAEPSVAQQPVRQGGTRAIRREKPTFNFHYNLAMEKKSPRYVRGRDGIFRKVRPQKN